ncbi:hypothetical protein ABKN59_007248 [Abortiporus biennis]
MINKFGIEILFPIAHGLYRYTTTRCIYLQPTSIKIKKVDSAISYESTLLVQFDPQTFTAKILNIHVWILDIHRVGITCVESLIALSEQPSSCLIIGLLTLVIVTTYLDFQPGATGPPPRSDRLHWLRYKRATLTQYPLFSPPSTALIVNRMKASVYIAYLLSTTIYFTIGAQAIPVPDEGEDGSR